MAAELYTLLIFVAGYIIYKLYSFIKIARVVRNIKAASEVEPSTCIKFLNNFLDEQNKINPSEEDNVKFILDDFNTTIQEWFFAKGRTFTRREAFVSNSLYFDLALYNHLSSYDENERFSDKLLHVETSSSKISEWSDENLGKITTEKATTYELTEFGITFYKMLASISKSCDGKKSIYFAPIYIDYQYMGESHRYVYCYKKEHAFKKLEQNKFTKTTYHSS